MSALAQDEERVAFWRRHTVSGIVLCEVIPVIIAVRTLTTDPPRAGVILAIAAVVALSAPLLALIPVDRLVRHPRGRLFFDAWEAVGIALVITLCLLDEAADSPYVLFLFVLLAHAALAYPPAGVALAGTSILAGYLGIGLGVGGAPAGDVLVGALALGVATATCAFASANHRRAYQRTAAYAQEVALLAERDGLTGALNHRAFHERLRTEAARATADRPLSLLLVDVDEFKTVNDTLGHLAGDAVLRLVGETLARSEGVAGRVGGDEFALLLPGTDLSEAALLAERLVTHVRTAAAPYAATVSVGAATVTWTDPVGLQAAADAAVYRAKHSGRNRVSVPPAASDGPRLWPRPEPDPPSAPGEERRGTRRTGPALRPA
ncbi:diguanylate cyclase [Geodermatophilus sp. SYSU D01176]